MKPGHYYIIAGIAGVEYSGRGEDRFVGKSVVLVKPDSTIVVHTDHGIHPRNYMGKATISEFKIGPDNTLKISAKSGGERLTVNFLSVSLIKTPFEENTSIEAEAGINDIVAKPLRQALNMADAALEARLRSARGALAKEKGVPPYIIFPEKTLYDIIEKKPASIEELLTVRGIGKYKVESYGDAILKALRDSSEGEKSDAIDKVKADEHKHDAGQLAYHDRVFRDVSDL